MTTDEALEKTQGGTTEEASASIGDEVVGENGRFAYVHRDIAQSTKHAGGLEKMLAGLEDAVYAEKIKGDTIYKEISRDGAAAQEEEEDDFAVTAPTCRRDLDWDFPQDLDPELRRQLEAADARLFELTRRMERTAAELMTLEHDNSLKSKILEEQQQKEVERLKLEEERYQEQQELRRQCTACYETDPPLGVTICCGKVLCHTCARGFCNAGRYSCDCKNQTEATSSSEDLNTFMTPFPEETTA